MTITGNHPLKTALAVLFAFVICLSTGTFAFAQSSDDESVTALEGLDPVLLVQGKEVQGNSKINVTRGRFQYLFANEEDKAKFEKEPAEYEIQLNGACARMGAPVNGNPDLYTVHKGRIYIFGSSECKTRFEAAPEKYLEAESGPKPMAPATAEALKKGQELLEKAVSAIGTTELIDSMTDYQEKTISTQTRRGAEVEIKSNLTILFPDRVRTEQIAPDYTNPTVLRQTAVVLKPSEAFAVAGDAVRPIPEAYRLDQQREFDRRPLLILRARKNPAFKAAASGGAKVGEMQVEQVTVDIDGTGHVLGIDPTSGRIISLSYRRRGPAGNFGEVQKVFSDFRTVNGVTLPFKITTTFDGQPWKEQSSVVESVAINSKIDPAFFEKPKTK